jgi:DNA polymerase
LTVLAQKVAGCTKCNVLARSRTNTVPGVGPIEPAVMIIGEAPGADEDSSGTPFIGASGKILASLLSDVGLDRSKVFLTNLIRCRPPGNRKPEASEIRNCQEHLMQEIRIVRPQSILCLGGPASQGLLNTSEFIGKLRGRLHDFRGLPVACTYHPAFLLPNRSPEKRLEVLADIRMLLRKIGVS